MEVRVRPVLVYINGSVHTIRRDSSFSLLVLSVVAALHAEFIPLVEYQPNPLTLVTSNFCSP